MKLKPKAIVIVLLLVLVGVVILQNTEAVETRILFFTITMPRALLLLVTGIVGAFVGMSLSAYLRRGANRKQSTTNL